MLIPILVLVAFLTALTGAVLENGARAARIAFDTSVARAADAAVTSGVADFTGGLASYVQRHGAAGPWPSARSVSAARSTCASDQTDCPLRFVIAGRITSSSSDARAIGSSVAPNLQATAVDEQRLSAVVTATVIDRTGDVLGSRSRYLTYRVFDASPYAIVSGSRDATTAGASASAAQGDSGGDVQSATGNGATAATDTRIHVQLTCRTVIDDVVPFSNDQQPAGNDGLPWGNAPGAAYEAPCERPNTPADTFRDERWSNGDGGTNGWSH